MHLENHAHKVTPLGPSIGAFACFNSILEIRIRAPRHRRFMAGLATCAVLPVTAFRVPAVPAATSLAPGVMSLMAYIRTREHIKEPGLIPDFAFLFLPNLRYQGDAGHKNTLLFRILTPNPMWGIWGSTSGRARRT